MGNYLDACYNQIYGMLVTVGFTLALKLEAVGVRRERDEAAQAHKGNHSIMIIIGKRFAMISTAYSNPTKLARLG